MGNCAEIWEEHTKPLIARNSGKSISSFSELELAIYLHMETNSL